MNFKTKATKHRNTTFFPSSSMLMFLEEKLLNINIEIMIVSININSKANILRGLNSTDNALFWSNSDAFSTDLKTNLSTEEFNNDVMAAINIAASTMVFNFNFIGLSFKGSSVGLLRQIINN